MHLPNPLGSVTLSNFTSGRRYPFNALSRICSKSSMLYVVFTILSIVPDSSHIRKLNTRDSFPKYTRVKFQELTQLKSSARTIQMAYANVWAPGTFAAQVQVAGRVASRGERRKSALMICAVVVPDRAWTSDAFGCNGTLKCETPLHYYNNV